ncbi:TBC1 domain family member 31-like [Amphiura filiformis]|uniref:TBC1 domain family member 31-like n=1 Tax=Amphiura filiformis TaxID=82378 RepID=UPI003B2111F4
MQTIHVNRKESGKIWHRKPSSSSADGLMVQISHDVTGAFAPQGRRVRFLQVSFDVSGDRFVAGDHHGNIYVFDIGRNRFQLVQKAGSPCTSLAFTLRRKTEFLVALSDYSLKCYDIENKELVAWMKGHATAIHSISIHASGRYALTTSSDTALLWDLDTFTRKRKLNIKEDVGIAKVFFLPLSNTIITCFRDDSIFAWESDTLQCKYQLPIPPGERPCYKAFATPRDGRLLVAAGKSRFLHVWALDTRTLLRIVEMPTKVRAVKQLEFLSESFDGGSSKIVGALSQDGIMRFINLNTCKLLFDIGSLDDRISSVAVSPTGRHVTAVVESGCVNVYSIPALMADFNKPPPPLVKAIANKSGAGKSLNGTSVLRSTTPGRLSQIEADHKIAGSHTIKTGVKRRAGQDSEAEEFSSLPDGLNISRLQAILKGYGEYPAKYRMFIWRSILRLPENHAAFSSLIDKGTHLAWAKVHQTYPIKSRKLLRVLQRTLSCLAHWSAIFGETDYLPLLAFPFVKLFQNNQLVCFEVIATVLSNWCQLWFEFFPNPPINALSMVENVLAYHDRKLLQHFVNYNVTSQIYAWPLLETLFSEVVTRDEWLRMFDNIFSNHPAFLHLMVVAYLISSRQALLQCMNVDDFKYFFHHRNAVDISGVIKEAYRLDESTPDDIHPARMLEEFQPLTRGQYPIFNKYPKFIVDYQAQEREKIRRDELDYLHQRHATAELQRALDKRRNEEEAWYRQQELLNDAEQQRRVLIMEEEQKLVDQRVRLQAMKRELRARELQLLDGARHRFLQHQTQIKGTELSRLDEEIERKRILREQETQAAVEDVEIRRMELQAQKEQLQQNLARNSTRSTHQQQADSEAHRRQQELEERVRKRAWDIERNKEHESRKMLQTQIAQLDQIKGDIEGNKDIEYRRRMDDLETELRNMEMGHLNEENKRLEEEVQDVMAAVADNKLDQVNKVEEELNNLRTRSRSDEHRRGLAGLNQQAYASFDTRRNQTTNARHKPILNEFSSSDEDSVPISLDRGRRTFEQREQDLMKEVRDLRRKIATETRHLQPPINYDDDDGDDDAR